MSAALYIVLNATEPGFDTYVDGRELSRRDGELKALAERLGVTPLMDFFSMAPEDMLAEAEEFNTGLTKDSVPPEEWFPASAGLRTVATLFRHLDAHPSEMRDSAAVANELAGFQHVLEEADKRGLRWHLAVDY